MYLTVAVLCIAVLKLHAVPTDMKDVGAAIDDLIGTDIKDKAVKPEAGQQKISGAPRHDAACAQERDCRP